MLALIIDTFDALKDGYQRWRDGPPAPRHPSPVSTGAPSPLLPATSEPPIAQPTSLPAVKHWCHPFGDRANPLLQLTQLAKAAAGYYPLGRNGMWHGGVHFDAGTAGVLDQSHVRCIADGEVVAYRIPEQTPETLYYPGPGVTVRAPFASGFVLVRHRLEAPAIANSSDTPPSLTFFSLYMHLQDWVSYQADPALKRPAFWPEASTFHVRMTVDDPAPGDPAQRGLNVRNQARKGAIIGFLPRGAAVTLSGEGSYRKLEGTRGPEKLQNPDGTLKGYIAVRLLLAIGDGVYRVNTVSDPLTVRVAPDGQSTKVGELPKGAEVTISGEGAYRKLESVAQYVHFASLEGERKPQLFDRVVVLERPLPIKAGDLIGHLGPYQEDGETAPQEKLHLEVFSADDMEAFLTASRAWAARLPAKNSTWLKLAAGTPVMPHQERYCTAQPPMPFDPHRPSETDLLVPRSLLDGLPAERKIQLPAEHGRAAINWYRLDALTRDSAGKLLDGWVREEVGVTPWMSPWAWEGYDIIYNDDPPENGLAYVLDRLGLSSEEDRERNRPRADASDKAPLKSRLYDLIDRDRNGKITADEMVAAISMPASAQSIAQLIIHSESEWLYRDSKWDALDDVLGHTTSAPILNWMAEKERIRKLAWWAEVA
ncbi:SH3 domain-containing protein, partial [Metapseudomonas boanensis]